MMKTPSPALLLLSLLALASFTAARADVLAITHQDFSLVAQGTAGFQYGYYTEANSTAGTFSTTGMALNGPDWRGTESSATPINGAQWMHPGVNTLMPAVRRYTVGSNGEPSFSGTVRITGRFYSTDSGLTNRFITVDGTTLFVENNKNGETTFDLSATVSNGSTIDLGVAAGANGNSDSVNLMAWIVTPDTALATQLVGSAYNSPNDRAQCFALATDGVIGSSDAQTFDTGAGAAFPYQFAGLFYGESGATGKATRIDSVRVDVIATNDFADIPRIYLLRHNSDPNTSNPAADDRYARLPIVPVRAPANTAGQPYYTFDLTSLTAAQRTGYGFAVVGSSVNAGTPIVFSEVSAVAARVADSAVITPLPFYVSAGGHRYARSVVRGDWEQVKADALTYGANLVQIEDANENQLLVNTFGSAEILFIGLYKSPTDPAIPGSFKWTTGAATFTALGTYQNWLPGQPDAFQGKDDYVEMNYGGAGLWANMGVKGHPETGDYCGIIELDTAGNGAPNFLIASMPATSNIFAAGLNSAPGGGSLPPSIDVAGLDGQQLVFPQIVGVIDTAADRGGPDGAHTLGRSCDLTAVGGISGYLNGNNTPALLGVFLAASQPASPPATINFSANAVGENFTTLAPELGQVFFIGDGFTDTGVAQKFTIPTGATKLYFGVPDGNNGTLYHGTPLGWGDNSGSVSVRAVVTALVETDIIVEQPEGSPRESGVGTVLFGTSNVNAPVTRTFTIRNSALATNSLHLTGTKPTVDGTNNTEFVAGDYVSTSLASGASTTVTVTFTPTEGGTRTATMHIGSDDADENPFDVRLSGDGFLPPEIAVSETGGPALTSGSSTVAFGSTVSGAGLVRTFTITNSGAGQLSNVAATIDGADSGSFTVTEQPSTTVAALGGTTQFTVRFAAGTPAGDKNAILHIASDDSDENPFNIALTGTTSGTVINGTFNSPSDVPLTVADLTATGLTLNLTLGFAPTAGTDLTLVNNTGTAPITGTFTGLPQGATITLNYGGQNYEFTLTYTGGTGNDIVLLWPSLTSTPTQLVGSAYNSPYNRAQCLALATDGVFGSSDALTFDTGAGAAFPYQFAGLLYLENPGTGKAARIDSVRVDVTTVTANDFADLPHVYLLRHNSDPNTSNPAADDRYARLPVVPVRSAANSAGQPFYTFDLTSLSGAERTGYGFAVVGASLNANAPIVFSEVSAVAARVADTAVIAPLPFLVDGPDNHRYGWSVTHSDWEQAETNAVAAGGHLVTINNATEQSFLVTQFGTENVFIGLKQDGPDASTEPGGGWRWRTGELLTDPGAYLNWSGGEPNGFEGAEEDYGFMNYASPGTWGDVRVGGYPHNSSYRGLIEVSSGSGFRSFFVRDLSPTASIFAAGLFSAPGGSSLPPSMDVAGFSGQQVTFPQIVGVIDTGSDRGGPDGAHTEGRSCDLTAVGGISGYLNGNNTPALVGVFLAASQPSSPPARLDFSANAVGENFITLAPELGQVFFIGDGFTNTGVAQKFTIPAGATKLYFGIPDGSNGTLYHGTPLGWNDNTGSVNIRATIIPSVTPTIGNAEFPLTGGQLAIVGGTGPYTVTLLSGSLPPGVTVSPTGLVSGTPGNGSYTFTLRVVDSLGATSDRTFTFVIENAVPVPSALTDWWPGEGAVGDIIGGYHGSLKNGATYATGKVDRCFSFDGVDDLMELPNSSALNLTGDFAIEAWIKPTDNAVEDRTIISKRSGDGQNAPYHVFLKPDGRIAFASRNAGVWAEYATSTTVSLNAWHHVAVTLSGGTLSIFVDGTYALFSHNAIRPNVTDPATVGASVTGANPIANPLNPFTGLIDELSLYSRALTPAEITGIRLAGSKGKARHEVARDYSATNNDGPVWSYRWIPYTDVNAGYDPSAANTRLLSGPNPLYAGAISIWGGNPAVSYNTTDNDVPGSFSWTPRQFSMHPGPSNEYAVTRWKAPHAGTFAVSGSFYGADTHPATTDVHIFHNATQLTPADKRLVESYRGDGITHTQIISVGANDTVDFLVGPSGNGYSSDLTGLAASIAEVVPAEGPEIGIEQPVGTQLTDASSTVSFGSSSVLTPVTRTFIITNTGTTLLTLGTPSADGDFTVGTVDDATLDPAQDTTLTVTFTPSVAGIRTGVLHILSDDADEASFDISLTGTGTPSASTGNAVFGWGQNIYGTIGDGTTTHRFTATPTIMTGALAGKQVVSVVAGPTHSIALTDDGKIFAWGGGTTTQPAAVDMSGALSGKTVIACDVGFFSSLALTSEGKVYTWGSNGLGELGLGDTASRSTPQLVEGLLVGKNVITISAGTFYAMALTSDGEVYGWGLNSNGQLGDGTTTNRLSPVAVVKTGTLLAGKAISAIVCAYNHTVVRTSDNLVFAWGMNSSSELGDGTTTNRLQPVAVGGALAGKIVVEIAGNQASHIARTSDGLLYTWGNNIEGQLGDGTKTARLAPVAVNMSGALSGKTVASIHMGGGGALVRTSDNLLYTWGNNGIGLLGVGTGPAESLVPVAVDASGSLAGKVILSCSLEGNHALVVAYTPPPDNRIMFGWGSNSSGEIGDGSTSNRFTPVPVIMTGALSGKQVASVVAGFTHNLAITDDGKLFAWGLNTYSELGTPTQNISATPVAVDMNGALSGKVVIACAIGQECSLALTSEGKVYSWGFSGYGQLGRESANTYSTPQLVQGLLTGKNVIAISAGSTHAMALTSDGEVYAWGDNSHGQLGDGTSNNLRLSPVQLVKTGTLLAGKTIASVMCSYRHTVARTSDGMLYAWGWNADGELGDGTTTDHLQPVAVTGALAGKTVVEIAGTHRSHLARTSDGLLYGWGLNFAGELGDGSATPRQSPVPVDMSGVLNGKTVVSIQIGRSSALARTADNRLYSWGNNQVGQLGVGTSPTESHVPVAVDVSGSLAGKSLIACSLEGNHALVIAYSTAVPDIQIVSSGAIAHTDGSTRDFGTKFVGGITSNTAIFTIQNAGTAPLTGYAGVNGITIDGANAAAFALAGTVPTSLAPGASTQISVTFEPQGQGAHEAWLHIHSNDPDEEPFDIKLIGTGGVPITTWRQQNFTPEQVTAGDDADDADPDRDGVSNLMEFALGSSPNAGNTVAQQVQTPDLTGFMHYTYTRNKLALAEVAYQVEWSDSLKGVWSSAGVTETITSDNGVLQQVTAHIPVPNGANRRFTRLSVSTF